jgi:rubredoxin
MKDVKNCPECGALWDQGDILEYWKGMRERGEGYLGMSDDKLRAMYLNDYSAPRRFSRLMGIEIQGTYDGVLYWMCPDCKAGWHRFDGTATRIFKRGIINPKNCQDDNALLMSKEYESFGGEIVLTSAGDTGQFMGVDFSHEDDHYYVIDYGSKIRLLTGVGWVQPLFGHIHPEHYHSLRQTFDRNQNPFTGEY